MWDAVTGLELATLKGHTGRVRAVAFSPDGKTLVSASEDTTLRLFDGATFRERGVIKGHAAPVTCCAVSPDGKTIASGSDDKTIKLWNAATGMVRGTIAGHEGYVIAVAFSPDGKVLASASGDEFPRSHGLRGNASPGRSASNRGHVWDQRRRAAKTCVPTQSVGTRAKI